MSAKVQISDAFLNDESAMMRVVDAGYTLKNRADNTHMGYATFDIEGPGVPDFEFVDLWSDSEGVVRVIEGRSSDFSALSIAEYFKIPAHILSVPKK